MRHGDIWTRGLGVLNLRHAFHTDPGPSNHSATWAVFATSLTASQCPHFSSWASPSPDGFPPPGCLQHSLCFNHSFHTWFEASFFPLFYFNLPEGTCACQRERREADSETVSLIGDGHILQSLLLYCFLLLGFFFFLKTHTHGASMLLKLPGSGLEIYSRPWRIQLP